MWTQDFMKFFDLQTQQKLSQLHFLDPIRHGLLSRSPGQGAHRPRCKTHSYHQLIEMKFCMSHYRHKTIPEEKFVFGSFPILEYDVTNIPLSRSERVIEFRYLSPENGSKFKKKMSFYVQNRFSRPRIDLPSKFQQFPSRGKLFHF